MPGISVNRTNRYKILLPWIWNELDGGTVFFACCWKCPPSAHHAKSFPCWASCQGLGISCHLRCLLAAGHQISMCACSRKGSRNKSCKHALVPPSNNTCLPPSASKPQQHLSPVSRGCGESFYIPGRPPCFQFYWQCHSSQVEIQLGGRNDNNESLGLVSGVLFCMSRIS